MKNSYMLQLKCIFLPVQSLANIRSYVHFLSHKYIKSCLVLLLTSEGKLVSSVLLILQIWTSHPAQGKARFSLGLSSTLD